MADEKISEKNDKIDEASELYTEAIYNYEREAYYAAIESLKQARNIPDLNDAELFVKIRILLSKCYRDVKDYMMFCTALEEAEKCMKEAYDKDPNNHEVNAELGYINYDFAKKLKFSLGKYIDWKEKALIYIETGNGDFKEGWKKRLNLCEESYEKFVKSLLKSRDFFNNALRLKSENLDYKYMLGTIFSELRHLESYEHEAMKIYEEILLTDKDFENFCGNPLFGNIKEKANGLK